MRVKEDEVCGEGNTPEVPRRARAAESDSSLAAATLSSAHTIATPPTKDLIGCVISYLEFHNFFGIGLSGRAVEGRCAAATTM